jgi:hypothetical protein
MVTWAYTVWGTKDPVFNGAFGFNLMGIRLFTGFVRSWRGML